MSLADLIRGNEFGDVATATLATVATFPPISPPSVASVASVAVANPENQKKQDVEIPDESEPAKHECRTCEHLKKPGLSDGHCSGRDDLPRAYGKTHPLRECPADGGASCAAWRLSRFYH
ncbi:MAG: hypothetical protein LBR88_06955 [Zoogloeaceae bacterium]|jgi:hypothetical protein|nr:hypothetical protein [Zoogloeaceae bacterium]